MNLPPVTPHAAAQHIAAMVSPDRVHLRVVAVTEFGASEHAEATLYRIEAHTPDWPHRLILAREGRDLRELSGRVVQGLLHMGAICRHELAGWEGRPNG